MGFTDIVKQSVKGIGFLGKKGVEAYQYRQSPEFAKKQIEELKLKALIEQQKAAIRQAQMKGRMSGNPNRLPPALSGNFNLIPDPFGYQSQNNPYFKKRR